MHLWQDAAVAVLAAIGLTTVFRALLRHLFLRPEPRPPRQFPVLLPARGDADTLQQQALSLELLRREQGLIGPVLLVDCGLTAEGRQRCALLERSDRRVILCSKDRIGDFLD